jgi:NAD+ kinase
MLLPDSMELRICVPYNSRSTAWASFDGRGRIELKREITDILVSGGLLIHLTEGDHVTVTASQYPFPTVCADKQSTDWFSSISRTLNWNQREKQKSFVMVEESTKKKASRRRSVTPGKTEAASRATEEEIEEEGDEEEDEDDKFDIDDLSETDTEANNGPVAPRNIPRAERAWEQHNAEVAAEALSKGNIYPNRVAFSKSGSESGVDSPSRFMGPPPHPPKISTRHVQWTDGESTDPTTSGHGGPGSAALRPSHSQHPGKPAKDKDRVEHGDGAKPSSHGHLARGAVVGHHRGRSRSKDTQDVGRRAFAVWGYDESDSNASDNDS